MDKDNLHEYQKIAVEHIISKKKVGLFLEMGLGKTVSTLTAINTLMFEELDINKVLIIGPKRVIESVWETECLKWSHLRHFKISKIIGSVKERKEALNKKADLYLISRDNISWLCNFYGGTKIPFDMLIIDELSSFKNNNSNRFKSLKNVYYSFNRIVGLTGTPAPNGLIDLWSQIYLLDKGERLGQYISQFRELYFKPEKTNGAIVYKYKLTKNSEKKIHEKISDICISMKASDYLKLPKKIINIITLELPKETQKKYQDFEKDQIIELFNQNSQKAEITAVNAASLSNKLLQFANGAIYDERKNWHEVHDLKIKALKDIMEEANGKPVLVAYIYKHDMLRIMKDLNKYNPTLLKNREDINNWNAGKIQLLIMHPASGGHGLNMQSGGHIIVWFGQTWSLELEQQFNARLNRQGQKKNVIINKLIVKNTMDEEVVKAIESKTIGQNTLMEAVKKRIDKYLN